MRNNKNILKDTSFEFAIDIIRLYTSLAEYQKEVVLRKQLLPSGTSVGAYIREAQNTQSLSDFIHKLYISQKNVMKLFIGWHY